MNTILSRDSRSSLFIKCTRWLLPCKHGSGGSKAGYTNLFRTRLWAMKTTGRLAKIRRRCLFAGRIYDHNSPTSLTSEGKMHDRRQVTFAGLSG